MTNQFTAGHIFTEGIPTVGFDSDEIEIIMQKIESPEETKRKKEEAIDIERNLGLALAPIMRYAVQSGQVNDTFTDDENNNRLWDICTHVADVFESSLISPRLVKRYIMNNPSPLVWQSGKMAQLDLFTMMLLIRDEKEWAANKADLARRF